jgi:hypothetical protein
MIKSMLKCLLVTTITLFTFVSLSLITVGAFMLSNHQAVQVLTLPTVSQESYLFIVTPCTERNSASIGVWTARSGGEHIQINALHNWLEVQSFFEERSLNRFIWRTSTIRYCVP